MKRWRVAFLLALLLCVPLLLTRGHGSGLLADSDTAQLLSSIRARHAPMSWFAGDWPLQNHFYRPLPTLAFELDNALYGDNADGYGWTNAVIACLCLLALFWLLRELTQSPGYSVAACALFSLWTSGLGSWLPSAVYVLSGICVIVGFVRHGLGGRRYLPGALVLFFLATQLEPISVVRDMNSWSLHQRILEWLPGRTASIMTLFALIALAAYARFERQSARKLAQPATALDRPTATRSTESAAQPKAPWLWVAIAFVATIAALMSYEQAVMLPAVLLGVAVYWRTRSRVPHWTLHSLFWLALIAYLLLRHALVPSDVSRYQAQQFRSGVNIMRDLLDYALPNFSSSDYFWGSLSLGVYSLFQIGPWWQVFGGAGTICTAMQARRNWQLLAAGLGMALIAFLPMAWMKQFGHYHFWPVALRSIFLVAVGKIAWDLLSIAACPPARQAPPRPSPAPGSLPHP